MKLETAIKQLHKESNFLGLSIDLLLKDIARYRKQLYSDRTVEAYDTYSVHQQVQKELLA
jgi:hypothetical protein